MYFFVIVSSFFIYKILKKSCDKPENREKYPRFASNLDEISNYFSNLNIETRKLKKLDTDLDSDLDSDFDIDDMDEDSQDNDNKDVENKDNDIQDDSQGDDSQGDDSQGDDSQGDDSQGDDSQGDDSQEDSKELESQDDENKIKVDKVIKNEDNAKKSEEIIENLKKVSLEDSISGLSNSQIFKFKNNKIIVGEDDEDNVIINGL
jgi:hypothetical protein